ncbi:ligase-associated DNA damage response endonuclease PdeM [Paracoccus kondratievae]|uniref:Metallophosphoesterase n=1 Tax=Paracoccus kondratievae TaxID=135740 RepID=A0AAD3RSG3_9RHOB|nr:MULTISPECIES: ligase-associated DNA damage response endonuclease PdeM [Paracoccus]QFQ89015.1 ligase-associated DNA damage response endonuclease PdeM [Paracoccus kondratievae]GLK62837.1 metallophosphoesterase [Paracoccus kondratievae]
MTGHGFQFHGLRLEARASGALWWPGGGWLIVADLHLGKSERMARRGGPLLPPYEGLATLERLGAEIAALNPRVVVSLGDGFDDLAAAEALDPQVADILQRQARGRDWLWIGGNHDPGAPAGLPGQAVASMMLGPVTLRHEAGQGPDISGHFHPVVRLAGERRRAFLLGRDHLLLPAFGAYTGGLLHDDATLTALVPQGIAVACGTSPIILPLAPRRMG